MVTLAFNLNKAFPWTRMRWQWWCWSRAFVGYVVASPDAWGSAERMPKPWEPEDCSPVVVEARRQASVARVFFSAIGFPLHAALASRRQTRSRGSVCFSGDAFALCKGCSWSRPGAAPVSVLWEPAGAVPVALTLLTCPFSVPHLVSSPSCCFYGTHLPGCLRPLSMLWAN